MSPRSVQSNLAAGYFTTRRAVTVVAALNLAYFGIEFAVALIIDSVALFADSIDFLEDAAVNFLVFVALAWSAQRRAKVGMFLAGLLLVPALAFLWSLWDKYLDPQPPSALALSATAAGALAVNLACSLILARHRHAGGSLTRAAFLSARNDALSNVAIITAGGVTLLWFSIWPDVIVGVGVALLNADAAKDVWQAARAERDEPQAQP